MPEDEQPQPQPHVSTWTDRAKMIFCFFLYDFSDASADDVIEAQKIRRYIGMAFFVSTTILFGSAIHQIIQAIARGHSSETASTILLITLLSALISLFFCLCCICNCVARPPSRNQVVHNLQSIPLIPCTSSTRPPLSSASEALFPEPRKELSPIEELTERTSSVLSSPTDELSKADMPQSSQMASTSSKQSDEEKQGMLSSEIASTDADF